MNSLLGICPHHKLATLELRPNWTYLTDQPEFQHPDERRALNRRLREFLMKQWVTIGVPKVAIAAFALIKEEKPGDADLRFSKCVTPKSQPGTQQEGNVHHLYARILWRGILTRLYIELMLVSLPTIVNEVSNAFVTSTLKTR